MANTIKRLAVALAVMGVTLAAGSAQADLISTNTSVVATASSEFSGHSVFNGNAQRTVDGSGMTWATGACYTGNWPEAWDSANIGGATGRNDWLRIDLGQSCGLDSLKLYNCNDEYNNTYQYRGIKHGAIYVSNSGSDPGNPLDNPGNWTLAFGNQTFTMASGRTDYGANASYNMPNSFSLTGTTARYIAITVDQIFGKDSWNNYMASIAEVAVYGTLSGPAMGTVLIIR